MDAFFESFESIGEALASGKTTRKRFSPCDFGQYSDRDMLDIPAHVIAKARRSASMGGRELTTGDNCASDMAVVRIPDHEGEITDFRPHLEWGSSNPIRPAREGRYRINRTFANKGIAPRLAEPAPPPATKTGVYAVGEDDTPLAPIERALVKGAQTIQLMRKAGGDADGLALLLGRVWGDEALFDSTEMIDLLGDVTLPRVLARGGKRRFEVYRNIGFTSLVSAGGSSANPAGYGDSAVINWQRRVELSKLFLHFAQALEGGPLVPGVKFSITARIPAFTVPHVLWSDLAMEFDPGEYRATAALGFYTQRAFEFLRHGLSNSLRMVSEFVRARGGDVDGLDIAEPIAGKYDQLTFLEPIQRIMEQRALRAELAFATTDVSRNQLHGAYKAHDLRVAVFEVLAAKGLGVLEVVHTITAANALRKLDQSLRFRSYRNFLLKVLTDNPMILDAARIASARPKNYEERHRKAEWTRIANSQLPRELLSGSDPYSPLVIALGTLHTLYRDSTSQVHRTVAYMNGESRELLSGGVRRKRVLMTKLGESVTTAIHSEIHAGNRALYRERYRRPGRIWNAVAMYGHDEDVKRRARLESAFWFARSDAAHLTQLQLEGDQVRVTLPPKREKSVAAVYLSNALPDSDHPLLGDLRGEALWDKVAEHLREAHLRAGIPNKAELLAAHIESYLEVQLRDHQPLVEVAQDVAVTPIEPLIDVSQVLADIGKPTFDNPVSVDAMVSYWVAESGASAYVDADEVDDLVLWMDTELETYVDSKADYIRTHSKGLSRKEASDLYDEWLERFETQAEEEAEKHRGEIA